MSNFSRKLASVGMSPTMSQDTNKSRVEGYFVVFEAQLS